VKEISGRTILLADREYGPRQVAGAFLRHAGFQVIEATRDSEVATIATTVACVLAVVARELDDGDGIELVERLRRDSSLPIILIGTQASLADRVEGLRRGADDYLAKPIDGLELVARVEAVLRRTRGVLSARILQFPRLTIDLQRQRVIDPERCQPLALRPKEFQLLCCLAQMPGRVWTRDELLTQVWGPSYLGNDRAVDVTIARLRQTLGAAARLIETVPGFGYRFSAGAALPKAS
jgi:DNA-binding response OmpR family regulator